MATVETPVKFDPDAAVASAADAINAREIEVGKIAREQANAATDVAAQYARHLADGGDPTKSPEAATSSRNTSWTRDTLVSDYLGLIVIYRAWNEARGGRNPLIPVGNGIQWKQAEALFDHFGEPLLFSDLVAVGQKVSGGFRASSASITRLLRRIADETKSEVVPRKTKVGGKVAYYIRERRPDDPDQIGEEHGEYREYDIIEEAP